MAEHYERRPMPDEPKPTRGEAWAARVRDAYQINEADEATVGHIDGHAIYWEPFAAPPVR
jgi:hypothetical protein